LLTICARVLTRTYQQNIPQQLEELKQSFKIEDISVANRTSRFEIVHLEKTPERNIRIELKNNYEKTITAYHISLGSTSILVETMLNPVDGGVHPGDTVDLVEGINVDPDLQKEGLVIRSVVFDDGTGDGEPKSIQEINDYRLGEMIQIKQTAHLLTESVDADNSQIESTLERVSKASFLSSGSDGGKVSRSVKFGAEDTRKRIAAFVANVKGQSEGNTKSIVVKLLDYCARKTTQFSLYNEAARINAGSKVEIHWSTGGSANKQDVSLVVFSCLRVCSAAILGSESRRMSLE